MNILSAPFIKKMGEITANMYRLGWNERNGGNISVLLEEEEVQKYLDTSNVIRTIPTGFDASPLCGKYFLVTGTGKYFRHIEAEPERTLGILRIASDGTTAELLWGYSDSGKFTSEFPAHMMSHIARLAIDPDNRVIMHCHPTNTVSLGFVLEMTDKTITHELWQMCSECIVVFPDGIGVLPWMPCGTNEIGIATAEKMNEYRTVFWGLHGIYCAGKDMDEAFGLVETVEKAAELYMKVAHLPRVNTITDDQLRQLAKLFGVTYREDFLS